MIDEETGEKTRSGLWFDYWKGISILRPKFVIIENVRALLNRGLSTVLSNLAEIGYAAEWQIISAENMGAPHKRERVWIVAYPGCVGWKTRAPEQRKSGNKKSSSNIDNSSKTQCNDNESKMANTDNPGNRTHGNGVHEIRAEEKQGRKDKSFSQPGGHGKESGYWTVEPAVGRLVNGVQTGLDGYEGRLSNKSYKRVDRLRGLGNAIVPQIAELLFNQIKIYL